MSRGNRAYGVGRVGEDVTRMLRGNCSRGIPAIRSESTMEDIHAVN